MLNRQDNITYDYCYYFETASIDNGIYVNMMPVIDSFGVDARIVESTVEEHSWSVNPEGENGFDVIYNYPATYLPYGREWYALTVRRMYITDFDEYRKNFQPDDFLQWEGSFDKMTFIDADSFRYGFDYDIYKPIESKLYYMTPANYHAVLANWQDTNYCPPSGLLKYENNTFTPETFTANIYPQIMGIATDQDWYKNTFLPSGDFDDIDDYTYLPIYVETAEKITNDFPFTERNIWYYVENTTRKSDKVNSDIVNTYNSFIPSDEVEEEKYSTLSDFYQSEDQWRSQIIRTFEAGTMVPTIHWPDMMFRPSGQPYNDVPLHRYEDKELSPYPNFGYYPPAVEIPGEYPEDASFYRYAGVIHTYFTTGKAADIYLDVNSDPDILGLPQAGSVDTPTNLITAPYSYRYLGTETLPQKDIAMGFVNSENFADYPKDGVKDGFYYEYNGTNELLDFSWNPEQLRSNAIYDISINSGEDLTIGDVSGASFTVDIQGNVKDLIKYLGRTCELFYDFENQEDYKSFGIFSIDNVVFLNHQVSTITAYDNIKKFDKNAYDFIQDSITYPISARELFHKVCDYCEVPYYDNEHFLNEDLVITEAFGDANLTGRQILTYIAQIAGGYIVADLKGRAVIRCLKSYSNSTTGSFSYETHYNNLLPIAQSSDFYKSFNDSNLVDRYTNQFPTELMDTLTLTNADSTVFLTYRSYINNIFDVSDNPFLFNLSNETIIRNALDNVLDQFWTLTPPDANVPVYGGTIRRTAIEKDELGSKLELTSPNIDLAYFIPTSIHIENEGVSLESAGQSTFATKIINTELTRQVDSLKNSVKQVRLLIPGELSTTLELHTEEIADLGEDITADRQRMSAIEAVNATQQTAINANMAAISTLGTNLTALTNRVSTAETVIAGLPTYEYVDSLNLITSITGGWKLDIGENEVSFYEEDDNLFIQKGDLTWKLQLVVDPEQEEPTNGQ